MAAVRIGQERQESCESVYATILGAAAIPLIDTQMRKRVGRRALTNDETHGSRCVPNGTYVSAEACQDSS
jgi:hypothetical protein